MVQPLSVLPIPDSDNLLRHVKPGLVIRDVDTGEAIGVFPAAFELREKDGELEDGLSCAWLEFYQGGEIDRIDQAVAVFKTIMTVKKNSVFVAGDVAAIKEACAQHGVSVRIVSEPEDDHDAHALVRRYRNGIPELQNLLADQAWSKIVKP